MKHADYASAVDFSQIRGDDTEAGKVLSLDELVKLFRGCQGYKTAAGVRDAAMLAVLYGCGLRRAELVALDVDDYSDGVLTIHGKGTDSGLHIWSTKPVSFSKVGSSSGRPTSRFLCRSTR